MSWVIVRYHPVTFFSLRPYNATASGGKTLIAPTAFALKMALLNATIQTAGLEAGRARFPIIRDLSIALDLPDRITVIKSFAKIRRPARLGDPKAQEQEIADLRDKKQYPFQSTIAYREFVQFGDPLRSPSENTIAVACASPDSETPPSWLGIALCAINYLGKRGSFLQPLGAPDIVDTLDQRFTLITRDTSDFLMNSTLQMLDDCGAMDFEHADIYSKKRIALGRERVLRHVALPYELTRSSRGYSLYERIAAEGED